MKTDRRTLWAMRRGAAMTAAAAVILSAGVPVRAFDDYSVGARPAAFSGAFTAVADDVHSLTYNPAGLALMTSPMATAYYTRLLPNLTDGSNAAMTYMAYAQPLKKDGSWGSLGLGWTEFRLQDDFRERTVTVGYARSLPLLGLSVGANVKSLARIFGEDAYTRNAFGGAAGQSDPVFNGGKSAQKTAFDLGAQARPFANTVFAASLLNVNTPDLGLASVDRVPLVTRLGAAYDFPFLKASVDLSRRRNLHREADNRLTAGVERTWLMNRYGAITARGGAGMGSRAWRQVSLGLGYEVNGVIVDYVYVVPMGAFTDTGNTHQVSLSFRFGKAPGDDELAALVKAEKDATARAEEALKLAQAEAQFVKEDRNQILMEVERLKAQIANMRPGDAGTPAADRAGQALGRELSARDKALREYNAAYQAAMAAYTRRVQRGATLPERIGLLEEVLAKYQDKGVDVSRARTELERVKSDLAQAQSDYKITLEFYKKTVADGADARERISLLERMSKKYGRAGVDISEVKKELEELRKK